MHSWSWRRMTCPYFWRGLNKMSITRLYLHLLSISFKLNYLRRWFFCGTWITYIYTFHHLLYTQLGEAVKKLEEELEEAKSQIKEKELAYKNCFDAVSKLENSIKDHDKNREGRLKDLEKNIKTIKAQMQAASKDLKVFYIFWSVTSMPLNFLNPFFFSLSWVIQFYHGSIAFFWICCNVVSGSSCA